MRNLMFCLAISILSGACTFKEIKTEKVDAVISATDCNIVIDVIEKDEEIKEEIEIFEEVGEIADQSQEEIQEQESKEETNSDEEMNDEAPEESSEELSEELVKLAVFLSPDTPVSRIITAGNEDQVVAWYSFIAEEDFLLKKLSFVAWPSKGLSEISLYFADSQIPFASAPFSQNSQKITFNFSDVVLSKGTTEMVVRVNVKPKEEIESGQVVVLFLSSFNEGEFEAIGKDSGSIVTFVGDVFALPFVIHQTRPYLSLADDTPKGQSVPGFNPVLKFIIAADKNGDVEFSRFTFKAVAVDNKETGWNKAFGSLGKKESYSLMDVATETELDVDEDWELLGSDGKIAEGDEPVAIVRNNTHLYIPAGQALTLIWKVNTIGVSMGYDTAYFGIWSETTTTEEDFRWQEIETGTYFDGQWLNDLPLGGKTFLY